MPSILAGYLYNWMQVPRCERHTGHMQTPCQSLPAAKSGHIYLEILVGLVWPRVFVCPPPPSKLGAQPFPIFFSPSVSLLTPSTLEGGARSNYQETQHSNFQEKCDQGGRWILSVSGISSICNANVSLSCLTAAVKHRSSGGGYLWQAITSTRPECPEYSNY